MTKITSIPMLLASLHLPQYVFPDNPATINEKQKSDQFAR